MGAFTESLAEHRKQHGINPAKPGPRRVAEASMSELADYIDD